MATHFGDSKQADILNLAVSIPLGAVLFFAAAMLLKIDEVGAAGRALKRRLVGLRVRIADK
jgi:hypothetical protein